MSSSSSSTRKSRAHYTRTLELIEEEREEQQPKKEQEHQKERQQGREQEQEHQEEEEDDAERPRALISFVYPESNRDETTLRAVPNYLNPRREEDEYLAPEIPLLNNETWDLKPNDTIVTSDFNISKDLISISNLTSCCAKLSEALNRDYATCARKLDKSSSQQDILRYENGKRSLQGISSEFVGWIGHTAYKISVINTSRSEAYSEDIQKSIKSLDWIDNNRMDRLLRGSENISLKDRAKECEDIVGLCSFVIDNLLKGEGEVEKRKRRNWVQVKVDKQLEMDSITKTLQGQGRTESLLDEANRLASDELSFIAGKPQSIPTSVEEWKTICSTLKAQHEFDKLKDTVQTVQTTFPGVSEMIDQTTSQT